MVADDAGMAKQVYDFVDFANLEAMPKENAYVDVCAMVRLCCVYVLQNDAPLRLSASRLPASRLSACVCGRWCWVLRRPSSCPSQDGICSVLAGNADQAPRL